MSPAPRSGALPRAPSPRPWPARRRRLAKPGWIGVVLERDDPSDRRAPGTLHIYGAEGYLGSFRANANGFIGDTRGVPPGAYTLQPKRKSGSWPAQTPAVTGPGLPPGQPSPGYRPDSVLLHPEGRRGSPDSRACITVCATAFKLVMHVMHQAPGSKVPLVIR